jgi:hypothetical protein
MSSNLTTTGRGHVARKLLGVTNQFLQPGLGNVVRDQQIEQLARQLGGVTGVRCRETIGIPRDPASSRPTGRQAQAASAAPEKAVAPVPELDSHRRRGT